MTDKQYPFLQGGGEMGALTREYNWAESKIGVPDEWPQSLRTTVNIILNSRFPMFLFWGAEHVCLYNDAYRPSLGNEGKHPYALGKPGAEVWPEIWAFIQPIIDDVLAGRGASWHEDLLLPIYRNGGMEDVYWTFSYSPVADEAGKIAGVFVTCTETTEKVVNMAAIRESKEQFEFAIDATELGTWDYNPVTNKFRGNVRVKDWFGLMPEEEIDLGLAIAVIAESDRKRVADAITYSLQYGSGGVYHADYTIISPVTGQERIVSAKGKAWFDEHKTAYRLTGTLQDITAERNAEKEIEASRQLAEVAINSASLGLFEFDLLTGEAKYSPVFAYIMTGDADKKGLSRKMFQSYVHPEDEGLRMSTVKSAMQGGELSYEPRVIWDDGSIHRIHVRGRTIYDNDKKPSGFAGTVRDITAFEEQALKINESERKFRALVEEAPVATCLFTGPEMRIEVANELILSYWGKDSSAIGLPLAEAIPELKGQPFLDILANIYATGITHQEIAAPAQLIQNGVLRTIYFDYTYKPLFDADGNVYGIMDMAVDVTEQVMAQKNLEKSRQELMAYFEQAPVAIAIIDEDELTFTLANPFYAELVGRKPDEIMNKPLLEALPELKGQGFDDLLRGVIATGVAYAANEVRAELMRNSKVETVYVSLVYQPRLEADGSVSGVLVVATDVTEQVTIRQKIEQSEGKLRSIIASAPAGIGLFVGRDLVIEHTNQTFIDIVGKGPDIEGMTLREAMPELVTEGQPFLQILDDVFTTGKMFQSYGSLVKIVLNGVLTNKYYNITYTPVFDSNGEVYAILDIAVDVTEQIKAQQQLQKAEADLRGAVEVAGLAMWSLDIHSGLFYYSPRFMEWLGFSEDTKGLDEAYNPLPEEYRQQVINAIDAAIAPGSSGIYDFEHPIINRLTGVTRIIHAQAQVFYDKKGNAAELRGTAQDITMQRELQMNLENEVQLRTEELASANEELQSMNEELASTNEELEETNGQLLHSNDELAQYAYVASHDLQEPLRKIRIFSDILNKHDNQDASQKELVMKISQSAERMSLLINGLLEFSRLLKSDTLKRPIDLGEVLSAVVNDFELIMLEKKAVMDIGKLPVIEAVSLQMNQLFYNLVSNALKFTAEGIMPKIKIASTTMTPQEVLAYEPNPLPGLTYYHVTFSDNGIGFDTKYSEQIFEVFKRLHGRDHYPGSGIGLALCRRIVANHNGYLFAESEPGKGTTFHLVVPDKQQNFESDVPANFKWDNN